MNYNWDEATDSNNSETNYHVSCCCSTLQWVIGSIHKYKTEVIQRRSFRLLNPSRPLPKPLLPTCIRLCTVYTHVCMPISIQLNMLKSKTLKLNFTKLNLFNFLTKTALCMTNFTMDKSKTGQSNFSQVEHVFPISHSELDTSKWSISSLFYCWMLPDS